LKAISTLKTTTTTSITQRGQVTIPAEIRRLLKVRPKDKVTFTVEGGEVKLKAARYSLESAFGSVKPYHKPEDFEQISREAKEAKAEKTRREMRAT
jgi:AbrB family looped-hinge helix DNA binding protein